MRVLIVGSGGREHALAWAIARSPLLDRLYAAPGNAGIESLAECLPIAAEDVEALVAFARDGAIDFVVVGPEAPLVAGLVDRLQEAGIEAFGPTKAAARLEGSKGFTKDIAADYNIPTAAFARFNEPDAAKEYIRAHGAPIVVKADGLAAGKGVIVCRTETEAFAAIDHIMTERAFGAAGDEVVVEEFLKGEEASFFALVDGTHALAFPAAQDHKRARDGDEGPNTGGMGAYSPTPVVTDEVARQVMERIVRPTIEGMAARGTPYRGVLYAGLMLTAEGPKLIEYNVRFGDPECQALLARLKSDLLPALIACTEGRLGDVRLEWRDEAAITVVMAAKGYPGPYQRGTVIEGLDEAGRSEGVVLFHAGTKREDGRVLANGGRVLSVTALGGTLAEARLRAYAALERVRWADGFYRRDIGAKAAAR